MASDSKWVRGFFLGVMKILQNLIMVMIAQLCEYITR